MDKLLLLKIVFIEYISNIFVRAYLLLQTLSRGLLCAFAIYKGQISLGDIPYAMLYGFFADIISTFFVVPILVWIQVFNRRILSKIPFLDRAIGLVSSIIFATIFIFSAISQLVFWDEFGTNFNFIAVDYLIYTHEIIGTLKDSMPLYEILALVISVSLALGVWLYRKSSTRQVPHTYLALISFFAAITIGFKYDMEQVGRFTHNKFATEISKNGPYEFITAFYNSSLDYTKFYPITSEVDAMKFLRFKLATKNSTFLDDISIERNIIGDKKLTKRNVVLIVVESLSAEFMGRFGNEENITPNLDRLASEGLLFTNLYATGTRTVRGLEALTVGIPPIPGESIIKRPNNHNLFNIAIPFLENGYEVDFMYGGYSYFDNMKNYFSGNGFNVIDRSDIDKEDITFANVWGVADEDLYKKAISVLDKHHEDGRKFFSLLMTTSNHRPYNFPEGRIDISQGTRSAAVKYTDYAIGKFIEDAKNKSWFKDTIFVIIADHCAASAGKVHLPVEKYRIPMIIYSPGYITPGVNDNLSSQIDVPPTILGMLGFNYRSKFFGQDIITFPANRAFVSTYQLLGYIEDSELLILSPNASPIGYRFENGDQFLMEPRDELAERAINYYQSAYDMLKSGRLRER
ncbi:MAG: hypothetical protein RLZZ59_76 [Pseudomonadota bacterium]|jgi:phosphoglycerol transferase MdoB-like AlkP superfamily enzyme